VCERTASCKPANEVNISNLIGIRKMRFFIINEGRKNYDSNFLFLFFLSVLFFLSDPFPFFLLLLLYLSLIFFWLFLAPFLVVAARYCNTSETSDAFFVASSSSSDEDSESESESFGRSRLVSDFVVILCSVG
jgi:hypothetical protein